MQQPGSAGIGTLDCRSHRQVAPNSNGRAEDGGAPVARACIAKPAQHEADMSSDTRYTLSEVRYMRLLGYEFVEVTELSDAMRYFIISRYLPHRVA